MTINFIKLTHQQYRLECIVDNQTVLKKDLEAKSFLRHDLMHYYVESTALLQQSFFGEYKYGRVENNPEIMQTEQVVAILQNSNKDPNYNPEKYFEMINNAWQAQGNTPPAYLSINFIQEVCNKYFNTLKHWEHMPTGEESKLELGF